MIMMKMKHNGDHNDDGDEQHEIMSMVEIMMQMMEIMMQMVEICLCSS